MAIQFMFATVFIFMFVFMFTFTINREYFVSKNLIFHAINFHVK